MKLKLNSQKIAPYVFVLPFVLLFGIFFVYAIGSTIVMSFQNVNIGDIRFIGLENYRMLMNTSNFPIAIRNSLIYTALTLAFADSISANFCLHAKQQVHARKWYFSGDPVSPPALQCGGGWSYFPVYVQ